MAWGNGAWWTRVTGAPNWWSFLTGVNSGGFGPCAASAWAFVATSGLAETARAQVSSRFDALKATEVRVQDAAPDGTNPFPDDVTERLERLNGINAAGLYFTVPDDGTLKPRTSAASPSAGGTSIPVIAAAPGALRAELDRQRRHAAAVDA